MGYKFYLSEVDGKNLIQLPVNPEKLGVSNSSDFTSYQIIGLGEVGQVEKRNLRKIKLSSFFPGVFGPYCETESFIPPSRYADQMQRWHDLGKVVKFVLTGSGYPVSLIASITDLEISEGGLGVGDLEYMIALREFRKYGPRTVSLVAEAGVTKIEKTEGQPRADTYEAPPVYTVVSGDTLWAIAKRHLGDGARYPEIATLNGISNPNFISIGQELKLP